MKSSMDGSNDPSLRSFSLLDFSVLKKADYKEDSFEEEFISSFLNAAKKLAKEGRRDIDQPGMYVIFNHSYALPVLYLARHCVELSIKRAIRKCGHPADTVHDLRKLWNSLLSRLPSEKSGQDRKAIKNMGLFIKAISDIDSDGVSLRYPKDRDGHFTQDRALFVDNEKLVGYLEMFVRQLESIDFEVAGK